MKHHYCHTRPWLTTSTSVEVLTSFSCQSGTRSGYIFSLRADRPTDHPPGTISCLLPSTSHRKLKFCMRTLFDQIRRNRWGGGGLKKGFSGEAPLKARIVYLTIYTNWELPNKKTFFTKCFPFGLGSTEPVWETKSISGQWNLLIRRLFRKFIWNRTRHSSVVSGQVP